MARTLASLRQARPLGYLLCPHRYLAGACCSPCRASSRASPQRLIPSLQRLCFTHIFSLCGGRAHDTVHGCKVCQMLKAFPQHRGPGFAIAPAAHKAPELGNPVHGLPQGRRLGRRSGRTMDGARKCLPFLECQDGGTGSLGNHAAEHCGRENPPGDDTVERQTALQPLCRLQLSRFDPTAAFENSMPDLNGMITNDKFCCTRWGTLPLSWWRRPLRLRS